VDRLQRGSLKYRIYVSTFGEKIQKITSGIPLEVGAELRNNFMYSLKDNTGDNISEQNPFYGECSGLYWVWKNEIIHYNDIIGFCHYNKSLMLSRKKAEKLIKGKYDIVVCRHQVISAMTIPDDYNVLLNVLKTNYPDYYNSFITIYGKNGASNRCNAKNTFITTGRVFNEYCEFLFDVLSRCRESIGDVRERKVKRYAALFAERLLTAYIYTRKLNYYEADILYSKKYMTIAKIIINRFAFAGDNAILIWLRNRFRKSPYKTMLKKKND